MNYKLMNMKVFGDERGKLVSLESNIGIDVQFHIPGFKRSDADGYFSTAIAHGADIGKQGVIGERGHAYVVKVKHIRGAGVVIVGGKQQAVAE